MIRTGDQYRDSLRDGREIWIDGQRVADVTTRPAFRPLVDIRARMYDMQHDPSTSAVTRYHDETGDPCAIGPKLPYTRDDWTAKRAATDAVLDDIGGAVTRVGDETVGEMWSLWDGKDVLNSVDARFGDNIERHIHRVIRAEPFHVSANTDPKGDRSKLPQEQDPDFRLHLVRETDSGIVVRGAKDETAAAYANRAFVKPTIANWGSDQMSDYALGFIVDTGAPGLKHLCRTGFAGRAPISDYPLANRFDEVDTLLIFDKVEIPWENVLLNSDYAGHRLTFQLFAPAPPFAHLSAVYRSFDYDTPLALVKAAAGLSDRVVGDAGTPVQPRRPAERSPHQ